MVKCFSRFMAIFLAVSLALLSNTASAKSKKARVRFFNAITSLDNPLSLAGNVYQTPKQKLLAKSVGYGFTSKLKAPFPTSSTIELHVFDDLDNGVANTLTSTVPDEDITAVAISSSIFPVIVLARESPYPKDFPFTFGKVVIVNAIQDGGNLDYFLAGDGVSYEGDNNAYGSTRTFPTDIGNWELTVRTAGTANAIHSQIFSFEANAVDVIVLYGTVSNTDFFPVTARHLTEKTKK